MSQDDLKNIVKCFVQVEIYAYLCHLPKPLQNLDHEVVIAMLEYLNQGAGYFSLVHDVGESSCFLKSDKTVQLVIQPPSGSGQSFLHFLSFNSLKLEIAGKFDLSELHGLFIESLDLRGCDGIELGKTVALPRLRELRIRPGQLPAAKINRLIKSSGRIEIIEDRVRP